HAIRVLSRGDRPAVAARRPDPGGADPLQPALARAGEEDPLDRRPGRVAHFAAAAALAARREMIQNGATMRLAFVFLVLASWMLPLGAAEPTPPTPSRIRAEINQFLELHHFLMMQAQGQPGRPEYAAAVKTYGEVMQKTNEHAVWQFLNDSCVLAP